MNKKRKKYIVIGIVVALLVGTMGIEAVQKAKEYGFSKSKQLTVEWVMKHPKEAVEIIDSSDWADILYIHELPMIRERYEEIIKNKTGE